MSAARNWNYTALQRGVVTNGTMDASSIEHLSQLLRDKDMMLIEAEPGKSAMSKDIEISFLERKPSAGELASFAKQLAMMNAAGVDLVQALNSIARGTGNPKLKKALVAISKEVQVGVKLSNAMNEHKDVFNRLFISLVRSGEKTGSLDVVLLSLAIMLKRDMELQRKMRSALVMPGITLVLALGITYYLLTGIIPQFSGLLTTLGGELPTITKIIMGISNTLINYKFIILALLVVGGISFKRYIETTQGRYQFDSLKLRLPLIGKLQQYMVITRVSRSLALLQNAGVNLDEAVRIVRGIANNAIYEEAIGKIETEIVNGVPLHETLNEYPKLFTEQMRALTSSGHQSGKTTELLEFSAEYHDEVATEMADGLSQAIEPLMTIFIGLLIGTIVIAMFLPYFAILQTLGQ